MRKRFEQQFVIGQIPIEEVDIPLKGGDMIYELMASLKQIFITPEYILKLERSRQRRELLSFSYTALFTSLIFANLFSGSITRGYLKYWKQN